MFKRKQDGFTIVELLIVVVVIAILAAITVMAYNGITQRSYAAKASSAVDAYEKLIRLHKAESGSYPTYTDIGLGEYACLTPAGTMPAQSPFAVNVCSTDYGDMISPELNTKLLKYASSLPNGLLPVVQTDTSSYVRGVSYYSDGTSAQILYSLNGDYACPKGSKSSYRPGTTECSILLNN
jgi:prepilin-type N-terminal cleavage/methylation domain-containing protein